MIGQEAMHGGSRFQRVDGLCRAAIGAGVTPGLAILAVDEGALRLEAAWGAAQLLPTLVPATVETIYDVASVTKALVTSVLTMQMVASGELDLDSPLSRWLPELAGPPPSRDAVSLRQLLCHSAGFPAHRSFYEEVIPILGGAGSAPAFGASRRHIEEAATREPRVYAPGSQSVYSDVGFIVLGRILERAAGARLDAQFEAKVQRPLGLQVSRFVDLEREPDPRTRWKDDQTVAATENCPARGRMIVGEVHDLNAYAMGGVAAHAGLFSTIREVGRIAGALVLAWQGGVAGEWRVVARDVIREFWRPAGIPGSSWRLGWDGPAEQGSQAGERLSRAAVGHLGFTGCSLWIDPERSRYIVVLANRIHPTVARDGRFHGFRAGIHDAIVEAFQADSG